MKPRILFIVQLPPPVHGVTLMNKYTVEHTGWQDDYEVKTLPLDFGQKLDDIGKITVGKMARMIAFVLRLCYIMITYRPSLVYFTIVPTGKIFYRDALFTWVIKLFRPHLVFHLHRKGVAEIVRQSPRKRWLYERTFKDVSVICLSQRLTQDIESVYRKQPFVLANGIDLVTVNKQPSDVPRIIYLSNLVKDKGILVFLQSVAELHKTGAAFSVRIVGEAVDYTLEEARTFCVQHGLSDVVQVVGPKFGNDKFDELRRSDIFVLPSFNECLPLSILEAMQFGLPVVSTTVGGIPDLVQHGVTGLLVQPGSVPQLVAGLQQLIYDEPLRTKMGMYAREKFLQNYTLEHFYDGLAAVFDQVLNEGEPRSKTIIQQIGASV